MEIAVAVGASVAGNAATAVSDGILQQIWYVMEYNDNIKDLGMKLDKLRDAKERLLHQVEDATKRRQEQIENDVLSWLKDVDEEISKVEKILEEDAAARKSCCSGLLPNVKNRYKFSRRAKLEAPTAANLVGYGRFENVGYRVLVQTIVPVKGYEAFESRSAVVESILEALKDDHVNMVGLWGLGGVGKTTLAKKITEKVKEEGIFQSIVTISVGQNPDLKKIQLEIGEWLDFKLEVESLEVRASRLHERLQQEESLFVVLDDVWNNHIKLEEMGILTKGYKSPCRILVTSRNEKVLLEMGVQRCFRLDALADEEARELFDKNVGTVEGREKQGIAAEIVTRCAGLPILILPVAVALKNMEVYEWKDALDRLKRFDNQDISAKAHAALELSYQSLEEDAKASFLLCAQFDNVNIYIPNLFVHCVGLGMFGQCRSLQAKRNRLLKVVNDIKSASLLLEGDRSKKLKMDELFKMHDVVRAFAFSMLSKSDEFLILARDAQLQEWPASDNLRNCTSIFLPYCTIPDLPAEPICPKLISFSLWRKKRSPITIPNSFFLTMKELRVLYLFGANLSPLPSSLELLAGLRTLYLYQCILEDISMMGELKNLQALCVKRSKLTSFPKEMAKLTCLQLLDLRGSGEIKVFPPNVLSCLTQLEELHMGDSFTAWGSKDENGQEHNADLAEMKCLKKLNALDIKFVDLEMLPDNLFSDKLERFFIIIGNGWEWNWSRKKGISRTLKLKLNGSVQAAGKVVVLLKKTEDLYLDSIGGRDDDILQLDREGFCHLKNLQLQNCHDLCYLVNSVRRGPCTVLSELVSLVVETSRQLEQICNGSLQSKSFNKLMLIRVGSCDGLRNLFPFSIAKCLSRLEDIEVTECENIERIFVAEEINDDTDGSGDEVIQFSMLRRLKLEYLPCLANVLSPRSGNSFGLQTRKNEAFFDGKIVFPNIEDLILRSVKIQKIWDYGLPKSYSCVTKLSNLVIDGCETVKNVFATSMVGSLTQLKKLKISNCKLLEEIVTPASIRETKICFPKLESLFLEHLHSLATICVGDLIECHNLKELTIKDCPKIKTFITSSRSSEGSRPTTFALFDNKVMFPNLEKLIIWDMPSLIMLWHDLREDTFCKLNSLRVQHATSLAKLFPSSMHRMIHTLETLHVEDCRSLEEIFDLQGLMSETGKHHHRVIKLSYISVKYLPYLKHIWNGDDPYGILSFENLRKVEVLSCHRLQSLVPAKIAKQLSRLERLVLEYTSVEQIICKEESCSEVSSFVFPSLEHIELWSLPRLNSLCSGRHTVDFPALERLTVVACPSIEVYKWGVENASDTEKQSQLFFLEEVAPKLKRMSLSSKDTSMIMQRELPEILSLELKILLLHGFHDESANFLDKLLQRFPNVNEMRVAFSNFEELFTYQVLNEEKYARNISGIKHLTADTLPDLKHIWNPQFQLHTVLHDLENLSVFTCKSLIHLAPPSASFNNLSTLTVKRCGNLASLFTCSTAASLKQLRQIRVQDCNMLVDIVSAEDGSEREISFDSLEILRLENLTSFASFCSKNYTLKFPSLVELIVMDCPRMEFFSVGHLSAPELKRVWLTDTKDRSRWKADLNSTIRQLHTERVLESAETSRGRL